MSREPFPAECSPVSFERMNPDRPAPGRPVRQKAQSPGLFGLLIVLVVVVAVVALYLSTRGEAPVRAEESLQEEQVDPFEGLPPEEPPAKQAETKGEAARKE
jgi:hypothetical protein